MRTVGMLLLLALTGCGAGTPKLDTVVVEHAIASSIFTEHHIDTTVSCPSDVPRQKGHVFTCMARPPLASTRFW